MAKVEATNEGTFNPFEGWNPLADFGLIPKQVQPDAPGASLDTSKSDEERARMTALLTKMQQQAASGGGAWESALGTATQNNRSNAAAIGQSQPGVGMQLAQRNIGNAQAAARQRGVGEANILRAKSQQAGAAGAQDLINGMGVQDVGEAANAAAVEQQVRATNAALAEQARTNSQQMQGGGAQGLMSMFSDGGPVPGAPKTFGDSEVNDTVPAWLSPGEIVLPRHVTQSENAPELAAAFVAALQTQKGQGQTSPEHFDAGGKVGDGSGIGNAGTGSDANHALAVFAPHFGQAGYYNSLNSIAAPSVENGGLLNTANFDANRAASAQNAALLEQQASGAGPSVVPQAMQNASDATVANAMQASVAGGRGGAANAGNVLASSSEAGSNAAGEIGSMRLGEQTHGQTAFTKALLAQRARDQAMATAQQQAAFRNTQLNAGLSLASQAAMKNLLSGAGQAAVSAANMGDHNSTTPRDADGYDISSSRIGEGDGVDAYTGGEIERDRTGGYLRTMAGAKGMAEGGEMSTEPDVLASFAAPIAHSTPFGPSFTPGPIMSTEPPPAPVMASLGPAISMPQPAPAAPTSIRPDVPTPVATRAAPKVDEMGAAIAAEQKAVGDIAAANEQKANAEAQLYAARAQDMAVRERHTADVAEQSHKASTEMLAKVQGARDEMASINTSVDTGRFWASRSTGQKITNIIGLVLGSFGTGPDGINRAAGLMQQAIDRDIDAQKSEHEFRLKKGQAAVDSATSMYGLNRQLTQDDVAADAAAHAAAWERTENDLKEAASKAAGPLAKANGAQAIAMASAKKAEYDAMLKNRSVELGLKVGALRVAESHAQSDRIRALTDAKKTSAAGGLGQAEQAKVFEVRAAAENIRRNLNIAKEIIKTSGTFEAGGTSTTELQRALTDVAQESARLKDPGSTVKDAEMENARRSLGVSGGEIFTLKNETALKLLESYENGIDAREDTALQIRGLPPAQRTSTAPPPAAASDATFIMDAPGQSDGQKLYKGKPVTFRGGKMYAR